MTIIPLSTALDLLSTIALAAAIINWSSAPYSIRQCERHDRVAPLGRVAGAAMMHWRPVSGDMKTVGAENAPIGSLPRHSSFPVSESIARR